MIVTIHQPEHLPWQGYFHKMALADQYVLLDATQYRHQYFQNRNKIIGVQDPIWVTVPVLKERERYGLISEVRIDQGHEWQNKYWGSIEYNYRRHPYFKLYAEELAELVQAPYDALISLNFALIDFFRRALAIDTPLVLASSLEPDGKKTDLILDVCLKMEASVYLSGPSGRDYLDEKPFYAKGLEVWYHDFTHPIYPQLGKKEFHANLSTLDLLMNCGPESRSILGLEALAAEREKMRVASERSAIARAVS